MYGRQSEKGKTMIDVRRLLVIKANLETVMQRDLETSVRVYAEQQLDAVCKEIEEAREEFGKLFEPQEIDQLKQRVSELEASIKEMLGALEYLLGQCDENERNETNFMGTSMFAREQATKAIQKARGQANE
jgi:cell division septum initiation protein DivIVA